MANLRLQIAKDMVASFSELKKNNNTNKEAKLHQKLRIFRLFKPFLKLFSAHLKTHSDHLLSFFRSVLSVFLMTIMSSKIYMSCGWDCSCRATFFPFLLLRAQFRELVDASMYFLHHLKALIQIAIFYFCY